MSNAIHFIVALLILVWLCGDAIWVGVKITACLIWMVVLAVVYCGCRALSSVLNGMVFILVSLSK